MKKSWVFALCCVLLITSACGWRLRGTVGGADKIPPIHFTGQNKFFIEQLTNLLSAEGLRIEPTAQTTRWHVVILKDGYQRRVAAINQAGQAQAFLLSLNVAFRIEDSLGQQQFEAQKISASRDLFYDQSAVLAKDEEETLLKKSLMEDVARQMIRRLQANLRSHISS